MGEQIQDIANIQLRNSLYWDVDMNTLSLQKHARFILTRTFEKGTIKEMKDCLAYYGKDKVKAELTQARWLSPITLAFCCCIFDLEKKDFRCFTLRQSLPKHGDW